MAERKTRRDQDDDHAAAAAEATAIATLDAILTGPLDTVSPRELSRQLGLSEAYVRHRISTEKRRRRVNGHTDAATARGVVERTACVAQRESSPHEHGEHALNEYLCTHDDGNGDTPRSLAARFRVSIVYAGQQRRLRQMGIPYPTTTTGTDEES